MAGDRIGKFLLGSQQDEEKGSKHQEGKAKGDSPSVADEAEDTHGGRDASLERSNDMSFDEDNGRHPTMETGVICPYFVDIHGVSLITDRSY
jgi:hypothetical protein